MLPLSLPATAVAALLVWVAKVTASSTAVIVGGLSGSSAVLLLAMGSVGLPGAGSAVTVWVLAVVMPGPDQDTVYTAVCPEVKGCATALRGPVPDGLAQGAPEGCSVHDQLAVAPLAAAGKGSDTSAVVASGPLL